MGIDVGARGDIYGLIRGFVEEKDRAVIFISSDVDEILEISDRILVMVGGEVVAELDSRASTKQEIMRYSTGFKQGAG
jgi:ABC-type sugar transport system ATPase subunit